MAAHAALNSGYNDITLYDPAPKQPDGRSAGVFYLHDHCDIPNIPYVTVKTYGEGTAEEYARKLYGDASVRTSFPTQSRFDVVYDGMYVMDWLWRVFSGYIRPIAIERTYSLINACAIYDRVISTMPLDKLYGNAMCPSVSAYIATAPAGVDLAYVEYYGDPLNPLYRASAVFGREALEFIPGFDPRKIIDPSAHQLHKVKKVLPMRQPLTIGHDRLLFAGRYGAWDKKCLTHNVYHNVKEWLSA